MKFFDLPTSVKVNILKYVNYEKLKNLASINTHLAILVSMALTENWIEAGNRNHDKLPWINLKLSKPNNLKFEKFAVPIPILRATSFSPNKVLARGGFKRRGKKPQFLPNPYDSVKSYIKADKANKFDDSSGEQFPWDTMVSTFDFRDKNELTRKKRFYKAALYEPAIDDETNEVWVYFALIYEGVKTQNNFKEIAALGIPITDIIGAVKYHHGRVVKCTDYWFNPNCTVKTLYPEAYSSISDFLTSKKDEKRLEYPNITKHNVSLSAKRKQQEYTLNHEIQPKKKSTSLMNLLNVALEEEVADQKVRQTLG